MPLLNFRSPTLTALSDLVPEITYVMCGARGETGSRLMRALPQLKFIGFEPDREEYERLTRATAPGFRYLNVAVGARDERCVLYVTRSPECSSLLPPNQKFFSRFGQQGSDLEVVKEEPTDVVALDTCLPKIGVQGVHFLDLDTQGTELDILHGATNFLSTSVAGVKCEVEFSPLYEGQALFGNVDVYLRGLGFMLFDLSRTRYRRARFPARALTRGQLLWGDALYLRNYETLRADSSRVSLFTLCLLAAHLGFHDYALEVLDFLLAGGAGPLSGEEQGALDGTRREYLRALRRNARWVDVIYGLEALGLRRPVKLVGRLATQLGDRLLKDRAMTMYNWVD